MYGRQFRNHEGRFGLFELLQLSFFPLLTFVTLFSSFFLLFVVGWNGEEDG
jgi:hypothetical protein